jgi:ribose transport system permease protein
LSDLGLKDQKAGNTFIAAIKKIFTMQEVIILLPIIALVAIAVIFNPNFMNPMNLATIGRRMSQWGLIAIGESLIIMTGNFDVSVGQMVAFINVFFTVAIANWGLPLEVAIILSILLGTLISTISGLIVTKLKVNSFLTTIAMLFVCRGLAKAMTYARPVPIMGIEGIDGFLRFGQAQPLSMSWTFFLFLVFIIIFQIILKKTAYGRKIYATGDSNNVARMAGVNTDLVKLSAFIISGTLVGISSVLLISKEAVGNANYGSGWELSVIAAVAIGGVSLMGGAGSMIGVLIGVIMMQIMSNILILLQINQHMQSVLLGTIMILATVLDIKRRNRILGKID